MKALQRSIYIRLHVQYIFDKNSVQPNANSDLKIFQNIENYLNMSLKDFRIERYIIDQPKIDSLITLLTIRLD